MDRGGPWGSPFPRLLLKVGPLLQVGPLLKVGPLPAVGLPAGGCDRPRVLPTPAAGGPWNVSRSMAVA